MGVGVRKNRVDVGGRKVAVGVATVVKVFVGVLTAISVSLATAVLPAESVLWTEMV